MRTLIAGSAFIMFFTAGIAVSACGSSSTQPTTATATAPTYYPGQPCPPPGYPNIPPGCPGAVATAYPPTAYPPTAAPTAYPTAAPPVTAAPATTATGMSTQGTIACTADGPVCGTAHCNTTVGKCANPCGSTQLDCIPGNYCTVMPLVGPVCQPLQGIGQTLP